jgi:hypothetical protein
MDTQKYCIVKIEYTGITGIREFDNYLITTDSQSKSLNKTIDRLKNNIKLSSRDIKVLTYHTRRNMKHLEAIQTD